MGNMYVADKRLACCSLVIFIVLIASSTNVVQGELTSYVHTYCTNVDVFHAYIYMHEYARSYIKTTGIDSWVYKHIYVLAWNPACMHASC